MKASKLKSKTGLVRENRVDGIVTDVENRNSKYTIDVKARFIEL